jgi:hypothetical protein
MPSLFNLLVFGYFGPETTLPLASVAAAAIGIVMMGIRMVASFPSSLRDRWFRRSKGSQTVDLAATSPDSGDAAQSAAPSSDQTVSKTAV